jgi:hypothetical protein
MAIDVNIDIQKPIKKKLASMKKDGPAVAPNPFRNKAEADAYKKNMESIVKPGYTEMGKKERSASEMSDFVAKKSNAPKKAKVEVMKKTKPLNNLKEIDLQPLKPQLAREPMKKIPMPDKESPTMEELGLGKSQEVERPAYGFSKEDLSRKEENNARMRKNDEIMKKDMEEKQAEDLKIKKSKLESLKEPATKNFMPAKNNERGFNLTETALDKLKEKK